MPQLLHPIIILRVEQIFTTAGSGLVFPRSQALAFPGASLKIGTEKKNWCKQSHGGVQRVQRSTCLGAGTKALESLIVCRDSPNSPQAVCVSGTSRM